jgi:hypothetical protein
MISLMWEGKEISISNETMLSVMSEAIKLENFHYKEIKQRYELKDGVLRELSMAKIVVALKWLAHMGVLSNNKKGNFSCICKTEFEAKSFLYYKLFYDDLNMN